MQSEDFAVLDIALDVDSVDDGGHGEIVTARVVDVQLERDGVTFETRDVALIVEHALERAAAVTHTGNAPLPTGGIVRRIRSVVARHRKRPVRDGRHFRRVDIKRSTFSTEYGHEGIP